MTTYNFDEIIERRGTDSGKWSYFDADVIPMFVADMDFRSPEAVVKALHDRVDHGVFGYGFKPSQELLDTLIQRFATRYNWDVIAEDFVLLPNLVSGIYITARAIGQPGDHIVVNTPIYWPFVSAAEKAERPLDMVPLRLIQDDDQTMRYEIDFEAFEASITPQTKLFILCNPHNPIGRVYEKWELEKIAEICLKNGVIICSDEIHCDLIYKDHKHISMASLSPEIAQITITLQAPSKTFNVPGMGLGFAVIQNPELREKFNKTYETLGVHPTILGQHSALAAYRDGQEWLDQLLEYLECNRDFLVEYVQKNFPKVHVSIPEGTYLGWLDFRDAGIPGEPCAFFLEHGRVALSGNWEAQNCEGFARINYGCPRSQLEEALDRMAEAYSRIGQ